MNKKFCDGCQKEIIVYDRIMPDVCKEVKITPYALTRRDVTDGNYEICDECYHKILLILKPKILQKTSVTNGISPGEPDK